MLTLQTKHEELIFVIPRNHTKIRLKCGAVREVQDVKCDIPFLSIVPSIAEEKDVVCQNHAATMGKEQSGSMFATKKTAGLQLETTRIATRKCLKQTKADVIITKKELREARARYKYHFGARFWHTKNLSSPKDMVFFEVTVVG